MPKAAKRQRRLEELMGDSARRVKKEPEMHEPKVSTRLEKSPTLPKISAEDLELLRQFDLDLTFGPCTGTLEDSSHRRKALLSVGISRMDRYERAIRHEHEPPVRILELINLHPNDPQVTHW